MPLSQSIKVNDYLTWESCANSEFGYECPAPSPIREHLPAWFLNLRGDIRQYLPQGFALDHTIRHCLGFRGLINIGYTIPLPEEINSGDSFLSRGRLHPEMLHGTQWAAQGGGPWPDKTCPSGFDTNPYQYTLKLLHWPWRARMPRGWRLLVLPYLLDWSDDYFEFSGSPDPNTASSVLTWQLACDPDQNYCNLETVIALRRGSVIAPGTVTFTAVPYFDPQSV